MRPYSAPGTPLRDVACRWSLTTATGCGGTYYYLHGTGEETESKRLSDMTKLTWP